MAIFVSSSELPLQSLLPQTMSWIPYALLYGGAGWGAGIATAWIFIKAARTERLRVPHCLFAMGVGLPGVVVPVWAQRVVQSSLLVV
jgi:hypothetical protein